MVAMAIVAIVTSLTLARLGVPRKLVTADTTSMAKAIITGQPVVATDSAGRLRLYQPDGGVVTEVSP
jgi:hypothetical protein